MVLRAFMPLTFSYLMVCLLGRFVKTRQTCVTLRVINNVAPVSVKSGFLLCAVDGLPERIILISVGHVSLLQCGNEKSPSGGIETCGGKFCKWADCYYLDRAIDGLFISELKR